MKICIDPGHVKGYNPGVASGYAEGTKMFTLGNYLKSCLESYGASVVMTRKSVTDNPNLTARGNMAKGCDMFISLHTNAASSVLKVADANFVVAYRSIKHPESKDLGDKLCNAVTSVMKSGDSGTYSQGAITKKYSSTNNSDFFAVVRSACNHVKYAYLIEHGFHTNAKQCKWLNEDSNLKLIAEAEAKVIAEYFGLKKSTITTPESVTTNKKGFVTVLNDNTSVRNSLSWENSAVAGTVNKGDVFTVVSDKIPVGDGYMYKLKSGLYITASDKYVTFKPDNTTTTTPSTPTNSTEPIIVNTSGILAPYEGTFRVSQAYKGKAHQGLDLVGVTSKKLFSRFNGKVEIASNADPNGFGTYVRLLVTDGPYAGCRVYFGHMSSVCVKVGDIVKVGQQVGVEGSTGRSTGSHCHYEVRATLSHSSFKDINKISGIPNSVGSYKSAPFTVQQTPSNTSSTTLVEVLEDNTSVRNSLSWNDNAVAGTVNKGDVFTVVSDKIAVGDGYMYKLKSGLYITASDKYVRVYTK